MVTVQEEVITTVDADPVPKPQPMIEEVMDEGKYRVFQKSLCKGLGLLLSPKLSDQQNFFGNVSEI